MYYALVNALSARMIHINLNTIFYTHVEHSPTKTIYIKYYTKSKNALQTRARAHTHTHTHTHNDRSRNWVLILGWKYCEKRKVFSWALKDDRVELCLRSCGSEFQMWGPKQEKVRKAMSLAFVLQDFQHVGVRRRA